MKEYKPLNMYSEQTTELKKLIAEHPDYPIVVMVGSEVVADDGYCWWYAPNLSFSVGELLDCEVQFSDNIYVDRDLFEEELADWMSYQDEYERLDDERFESAVKCKLSEYEKYWKPVIEIRADV